VLVLSRRLNEKIVLPDLGITVQVVALQGNTVRLAIEAPPEVKIAREELLHKPHPSARPGSRRATPSLCSA
jgi:carbon storage regulator CsrA